MPDETKFDKELRTKWVEALRSGKYLQNKGALRKDNSFCCLGVACDVAKLFWTLRLNTGFYSVLDKRDTDSFSNEMSLPETLRKQLGLSSAQQSALAHLNDFENSSFEEIADAIEKMPIETL